MIIEMTSEATERRQRGRVGALKKPDTSTSGGAGAEKGHMSSKKWQSASIVT